MLRRLAFLIFTFTLIAKIQAQSVIKGKVQDGDGNPLPYVSIFISDSDIGVSTNQEGFYEILIQDGTYEIVFSHLGFKQHRQVVALTQSVKTLNVILYEQSIVIAGGLVGTKKEDPAYTIIRKAMSKAKYHLLQYESYTAKVYMKGSTELEKVPGIFKNELAKEGVFVGQPYTLESVSEISFKQPNIFKEKVIAIKQKGSSGNTSPNIFINASFYKNMVAGNISPLASAGMQYYRYKYEGGFEENGLWINKIKVTPKSKGQYVFDGYIYIIENLWAIHSLNLTTNIDGFTTRVKQQYRPFNAQIWLPISHNIALAGSKLGFKLKYHYHAVVEYKDVVPNKDLIDVPEIIDEKIDTIHYKVKKPSNADESVKTLSKQEKLSRKDFNKLIKTYESEIEKQGLERDFSWEIDSLAHTKDSLFWEEIRPIPLTEEEKNAYQKEDSFYFKKELDSSELTKTNKNSFSEILLLGSSFKISDKINFQISPLLFGTSYNTIEGYLVDVQTRFNYRKHPKYPHSWSWGQAYRYGFASQKFYYKTDVDYKYRKDLKTHHLSVQAGRFVRQFNENAPISESLNSFYSLFFRANYLRLLEESFAELKWTANFKESWVASIKGGFYDRKQLQNNSDYSFFFKNSRTFEPNIPQINSYDMRVSEDNSVVKTDFYIEKRFGVKYYKYNGNLRSYNQSGNTSIGLHYSKGAYMNYIHSKGFDLLAINGNYQKSFGVRGDLHLKVKAGTAVSGSAAAADMFHFVGNQTLFIPLNIRNNYAALDYYSHSVSDLFLSGFARYSFRKLMLTQHPILRMSGLEEALFVNYLEIPNYNNFAPRYYEIGYSLDKLFTLFRLDLAIAFSDNQFKTVAPRIGLGGLIRF